MNILNVTGAIDLVTGGGEAERSYQMSLHLAQSGANCKILTINQGSSGDRKNTLDEGMVTALPCLLKRFKIPRCSFGMIEDVVRKADVVHLMGHWSLLNAIVYLAIRKLNKPYVVCPAGALKIFGRSKYLKRIYNIVIGNKIIINASMCIAVTQNEVDSFIAYGVHLDRIRVIPNGIPDVDLICTNDERLRNKIGLTERPFILFVGRLNLIKGPDLLLKAFCNIKDKFPGVDLMFVGPDGGMLTELKMIVKDECMEDRVRFLGYLDEIGKSQAYRASMFIVIPSRHEAMSIVALEAGITGTPVLLTDQCGFNQISDVGGGWVVAATVDGLSDGLSDILANPGQIEVAAKNIKRYVRNNFSWDIVVNQYWKLYADILDRRVS